jgi:hypothetical protein
VFSGSVSPVSTGTLSTLLNDLPPPSYPGYPPLLPLYYYQVCLYHTDKKENQIVLIYKEIQRGAVAKSYSI